jgi:hypothetical protein
MRRLWKHYSLSIVLLGLLLVSWALQTWMGWHEFVSEQQTHGESAVVFGPDGYVWGWGQATFENWQSEFLQLLTFVVLTTFLVHRGSHESRDQDEHTQSSLDRIEARLIGLERDRGIHMSDEDIDVLVLNRIERLKVRDAVRDDLPPPVPRVWYPEELKNEVDSAEAGKPTIH